MTVTTIIGMQWGDEAKGKFVDFLAKDFDYIVRFNGGDNAGHTIKVGERRFGLHLIPSGIFYPEKFKVIGNGVVINPETLLKEIEEVESAGYSLKNLLVSDRAHLILPWHKILDGIEDEKSSIGTTKKGIGPVYTDKASRLYAIRICDLLDEKLLKEKVEKIAKAKQQFLKSYGMDVSFNNEEILSYLLSFAKKIKPHIVNTAIVLNEAVTKDKKVLLEGAQGTLLDVDHGTYPYVTASNTTAGGACTGSGIPPKALSRVIGISKAYTTRVGSGPFPTELKDEIGERIRKRGNEFGTTTGRPRRCGWLDLIVLRYSAMINGITEIAITKLDVLSGMDELKICTHYTINGREMKAFPAGIADLEHAKPVYKSFKGWGKFSDSDWKAKKLPAELLNYIKFIEKETCVKVSMLSFGPEREQTIIL